MQEFIANTVGEVLALVELFPHELWILRGQADAAWPLLPKAGRPEYFIPNREDEEGYPLNLDLARFEQWRHWAVAYHPDLPTNDFEALAFAQHYGLATRLLDWTTNPLIAIYFAVADEPHKDGGLYIHLPRHDSQLTTRRLTEINQPVMFTPRPLDKRILNQYAAFTYHPAPNEPLDSEPLSEEFHQLAPLDVKDRLIRVRIPRHSKECAVSQLDRLGINHRTLFPDLGGLSAFINWQTRQVAGKVPERDPMKPLPQIHVIDWGRRD